MLNEFVEKIVVHERDRKGSQDTTQEVEIYFNFVGKYVPPHFREVSLTPETGGNSPKRRTPGQASPKLFAAQGQRRATGIRGTGKKQRNGRKRKCKMRLSAPRTWQRACLSPSAIC